MDHNSVKTPHKGDTNLDCSNHCIELDTASLDPWAQGTVYWPPARGLKGQLEQEGHSGQFVALLGPVFIYINNVFPGIGIPIIKI